MARGLVAFASDCQLLDKTAFRFHPILHTRRLITGTHHDKVWVPMSHPTWLRVARHNVADRMPPSPRTQAWNVLRSSNAVCWR